MLLLYTRSLITGQASCFWNSSPRCKGGNNSQAVGLSASSCLLLKAEKNKELVTENSILREQNDILMRQKAIQQRKQAKSGAAQALLVAVMLYCGRDARSTQRL